MADEVQKMPATDEEIARRIDLIKGLIVKRYSQARIVRYCLKTFPDWNVSDRWLREYCHRAEASLKEDLSGMDLQLEVYKELLLMNEVSRQALAKGDLAQVQRTSNDKLAWMERFGVRLSPNLDQKALARGLEIDTVIQDVNEAIEVSVNEIEITA